MPLFQSKIIFDLLYQASIYKDFKALEDKMDETFNQKHAYYSFAKAIEENDVSKLCAMLNGINYTLIGTKSKP